MTLNLRVTRVLSRRFGGVLFTAVLVDGQSGEISDAKAYAVVKASSKVVSSQPLQVGTWLAATGAVTSEAVAFEGFTRRQVTVIAESLRLVRPSGEHIVRFLADSKEFKGVGTARARQLWNRYGDELYVILDEGNADALTSVLPHDLVPCILAAWIEVGTSEVLLWLNSCNFSLSLSRKVIRYFGRDTKVRLQEDPYRLLSFTATWKETDNFAMTHFGVAADDKRRLLAACEEALYRSFADGHTALPPSLLKTYLKPLLGGFKASQQDAVIEIALASSHLHGGYVVTGDLQLQSVGAAVIERNVAKALVSRLKMSRLFQFSVEQIQGVIAEYQLCERITLSDEQKAAVEATAQHHLICISGGAGVGKTTVLKAVLAILDASKTPVILAALAGRAAKRISDTTGRDAMTIAALIRSPELSRLEDGTLIIDEASMVDVVSISRVLALLPSSCQLILVGDASQLMPVGPGLVFHALLDHPSVPRVLLTKARRFGNEIAQVANSIRDGVWPQVGSDSTSPSSFIEVSAGNDLADLVVDMYVQEKDDTQVICATRNGPLGTRQLNIRLQSACNPTGDSLLFFNEDTWALACTGLRLNDLVLCTRTNYELDLRNGSLGRIVEVLESSVPMDGADMDGEEDVKPNPIAWVDWDDGVKRPMFVKTLLDLELGYAITIHKAQGSQWGRVLIPVVRTRNLDRSMLYTALTRAQRQVVMIGDVEVARKATESPPAAKLRRVGLHAAIAKQ
ncbi:AAA family ATPase [Undibacterium sp.]|uniref:ATP-dependent DNA helicase n=1 Tax=Undibacterium sp. TaxID=1914977 RepID=UPI0025FB066C|nr:AAA family ATPase [Undibacterium sp.]